MPMCIVMAIVCRCNEKKLYLYCLFRPRPPPPLRLNREGPSGCMKLHSLRGSSPFRYLIQWACMLLAKLADYMHCGPSNLCRLPCQDCIAMRASLDQSMAKLVVSSKPGCSGSPNGVHAFAGIFLACLYWFSVFLAIFWTTILHRSAVSTLVRAHIYH